MVKLSIIVNRPTKDLEYSELVLNVSGLSCVYLNSIKRILYEYIPTYAFNQDNIIIEKSNTFLDNSRLRDRFQFLPIINLDPKIDYLDEKYYVNLDFENEERPRHPQEKSINIVFKNYNNREEYKNVDTNTIQYFINGKEEKSPYNRNYPILLCYLRNGEYIECVMKSSLGIGLMHPIYQPVYHTFYRENEKDNKTYDLIVHSKGQVSESDLLKKMCRTAKIILENHKKSMWKLLHEENIFAPLVYEYQQYRDPEDIKNITMDNFTFANIICEELQKDSKNILFAGVSKENFFDKVVHLKIRFNNVKDDKKQHEIIINAINECIKKFDDLEKELNKLFK